MLERLLFVEVGPLVFGLLICGLAALLLYGSGRSCLVAASVYRTDATPVRRVPDAEGPVEFDGRVEPPAEDGTFEAPFSGREALYCQIRMESASERRRDVEGARVLEPDDPVDAKTETDWLLAESGEIRRPFVVREGGGRVRVDPSDADVDLDGHTGDVVATAEPGESLPEAARERLRALDAAGIDFDCDPDAWAPDDATVKYREARLEPGDDVHVAGAAVEAVADEWGSATDATVGASSADRFLISEGSESTVLREHAVQTITGLVVGLALAAGGLYLVTSALPA